MWHWSDSLLPQYVEYVCIICRSLPSHQSLNVPSSGGSVFISINDDNTGVSENNNNLNFNVNDLGMPQANDGDDDNDHQMSGHVDNDSEDDDNMVPVDWTQ